jgi:threonine dehydrogenase-like Zn-dependent dehydrogenase
VKALYFNSQRVELVDHADISINPGEVLVEVVMAGICRTDIELLHGYYEFRGVAGHEFVGVIEKSPGNSTLVGRRVTADINIGCGECESCRTDDGRHCAQRKVIGIQGWDGAFAQYVKVPTANLHMVPEPLSNEQAVFAEPLAAALRVSRQVVLGGSRRALILGDGNLGLLLALALLPFDSELLLVGRHADRLKIASELGVNTHLADRSMDPGTLAAALGNFDIVIEATGRPGGIEYAMALVKPKGTIVMKTTIRQAASVDITALAVREITMIGSRCGDLDMALSFLNEGRLDVTPLIGRVFPMEHYKEAFDLAQQPGSGKVMITF